MYRPPAFVEDDPARLAALIHACPLACLVINGDEGLAAAHAPLLAERDDDGRIVALVGHLARANPFWSQAPRDAEVLVIFCGPDAYVSPSMYPSKAEHGRVVPTWNYGRVEARGRLYVETSPDRVRPYFERLTDVLEADRETPWSVDDAPVRYVEGLQQALVGLRIDVTDIRGVLKLSQNRDARDFAGVMTDLSASPNPTDQAVSKMMASNARLD